MFPRGGRLKGPCLAVPLPLLIFLGVLQLQMGDCGPQIFNGFNLMVFGTGQFLKVFQRRYDLLHQLSHMIGPVAVDEHLKLFAYEKKPAESEKQWHKINKANYRYLRQCRTRQPRTRW